MSPILSHNELHRYVRHLSLPGFGLKAQERLKAARVLVVGAGGLGCPLLQYLAAAGIGTIGIIDDDIVSESNLQRQVLFGVEDIGKRKADVATQQVNNLNPFIFVHTYIERLSSANALQLFAGYDIIADCTDNFPTRYLVNDAAVFSGKPYVYGSIFRYEGQVAVFNKEVNRIKGPNYRDLYPSPPMPGEVPACEDAGVLGVLPGIIGTMQALEIIKLLAGIGNVTSGVYHMFDAVNMEMKSIHFKARPDNPISGTNPTIQSLQDYDLFCGISTYPVDIVKQISMEEFISLRDSDTVFQIIDVREAIEYEEYNIGGIHIPLSAITENVSLIRKDVPVIFHCQTGQRSQQAIAQLQSEFQFTNLLNLEGGIAGLL